MARSAFTTITIPATGYNLTDSADFAALSTGAGNGKEVVYDPASRIVLKNTTGGAAAFTIKVPTPSQYSSIGITLSDMTVTVAASKTWELKPHATWQQSDGKVYIDCDVAGSLLVLI
jgi:hypothetical protein